MGLGEGVKVDLGEEIEIVSVGNADVAIDLTTHLRIGLSHGLSDLGGNVGDTVLVVVLFDVGADTEFGLLQGFWTKR